MKIERFFFVVLVIFMLVSMFSFLRLRAKKPVQKVVVEKQKWLIQSIDTMKYSRDLAREASIDPAFDTVIDSQVSLIAKSGATYVAIDTPYDDEFIPMLSRWVAAARRYHLHVWFRGNFSGWEGWFGYSGIDEEAHLAKVKSFILKNRDLFVAGDIFTSCPECENGAKPNLHNTASVSAYRRFLIEEYQTSKDAFVQIHKSVATNYFSMNKDVADAVMDQQTTSALEGIVVIDHYVRTPDILANDIRALAKKSGGKVVLGEFGVPIPDINGPMTDEEQKAWIEDAFTKLSAIPDLIGVNYWVNMGGSTALWELNRNPKPAVSVIKRFYQGEKK